MNFYKNIDDINAYTFFEIIDNGNVKLLIKKYDENKHSKIKDSFLNLLNETFESILKDFNAINADSKIIGKMKEKSRIDLMESEYEICSKAIKLYLEFGTVEFLQLLNEYDYKFDSTKDINRQVKRYLRKLKTLKMKIKIKKAKYYKEHDLKIGENFKYVDKLEEKAFNMEKILDLKYKINPRKTRLRRWCLLSKKAIEKSLKQRHVKTKHKR